MRRIGFSGLTALALVFIPAATDASETKILTPKIEGTQFRIDCERDFPNGRPTLNFLGRLESHIHGAKNPDSANVNLYTHPQRDRIVNEITERLGFVERAQARALMFDLFRQYDEAAKTGREYQHLKFQLLEIHQIGDDFFRRVEARCE